MKRKIVCSTQHKSASIVDSCVKVKYEVQYNIYSLLEGFLDRLSQEFATFRHPQ